MSASDEAILTKKIWWKETLLKVDLENKIEPQL